MSIYAVNYVVKLINERGEENEAKLDLTLLTKIKRKIEKIF